MPPPPDHWFKAYSNDGIERHVADKMLAKLQVLRQQMRRDEPLNPLASATLDDLKEAVGNYLANGEKSYGLGLDSELEDLAQAARGEVNADIKKKLHKIGEGNARDNARDTERFKEHAREYLKDTTDLSPEELEKRVEEYAEAYRRKNTSFISAEPGTSAAKVEQVRQRIIDQLTEQEPWKDHGNIRAEAEQHLKRLKKQSPEIFLDDVKVTAPGSQPAQSFPSRDDHFRARVNGPTEEEFKEISDRYRPYSTYSDRLRQNLYLKGELKKLHPNFDEEQISGLMRSKEYPPRIDAEFAQKEAERAKFLEYAKDKLRAGMEPQFSDGELYQVMRQYDEEHMNKPKFHEPTAYEKQNYQQMREAYTAEKFPAGAVEGRQPGKPADAPEKPSVSPEEAFETPERGSGTARRRTDTGQPHDAPDAPKARTHAEYPHASAPQEPHAHGRVKGKLAKGAGVVGTIVSSVMLGKEAYEVLNSDQSTGEKAEALTGMALGLGLDAAANLYTFGMAGGAASTLMLAQKEIVKESIKIALDFREAQKQLDQGKITQEEFIQKMDALEARIHKAEEKSKEIPLDVLKATTPGFVITGAVNAGTNLGEWVGTKANGGEPVRPDPRQGKMDGFDAMSEGREMTAAQAEKLLEDGRFKHLKQYMDSHGLKFDASEPLQQQVDRVVENMKASIANFEGEKSLFGWKKNAGFNKQIAAIEEARSELIDYTNVRSGQAAAERQTVGRYDRDGDGRLTVKDFDKNDDGIVKGAEISALREAMNADPELMAMLKKQKIVHNPPDDSETIAVNAAMAAQPRQRQAIR